VIALIAATLALLSGGIANGVTNKSHPALRLMDSAYVAVRGTGFKPHERVRVVVVTRVRKTKRVVAGAAGRFTVRFPRLNSSDCYGLSVTAVGSKGSRASLKVPRGECTPR